MMENKLLVCLNAANVHKYSGERLNTVSTIKIITAGNLLAFKRNCSIPRLYIRRLTFQNKTVSLEILKKTRKTKERSHIHIPPTTAQFTQFDCKGRGGEEGDDSYKNRDIAIDCPKVLDK